MAPVVHRSASFARSLSLLALAVLAWSPLAAACECLSPGWILPDASVKEVPSNTRVWISASCNNPSLARDTGETIPTSRSAIGRSGTKFDEVVILTPQSNLEVGATYTIQGCTISSVGGSQGPVSFTVTSGVDSMPPEIPRFSPQEPVVGAEDSCGKDTYWKATLEGDGTFHLLDIAGRAGYDPATRSGSALEVFLNPSGAPSTSMLSVGEVSCGTNWSFKNDGDATALRLSSLDLAGNFSGWSAPQTLTSPLVDEGCGCATPGKPRAPSLWSLVAAVVMTVVVRRRRHA